MYYTFSGNLQVLVTRFDNSSLSDLESCDIFSKLPSYKGLTSTFAVAKFYEHQNSFLHGVH